MSPRVFIAGSGASSGFGVGCSESRGRDKLFDGIWSGTRAVLPRDRTAGFEAPTDVAAEVPGLEGVPEDDHALVIGVQAAREALAQAGVEPATVDLIYSSTKGSLTGLHGEGDGRGYGSVGRLAGRLRDAVEARSLVGALTCACASGVLAIAYGARRVLRGESERVLVVGSDVLNEFIIRGFGALNALDPVACRPFDAARRGISLGDGAAAVLLTGQESESIGIALTGWGGANDACHVTGPDRQGAGIVLAAERALGMAGVAKEDVDVVHLHGTGTAANDTCEAIGVARLFDGQSPPAFGTKAQTGHTLGAAGILETMIAAEAVRRGEAPANVGLEDVAVDPGLDLTRAARSLGNGNGNGNGNGKPGRCALKVANGFGGILGAMVIET